MSSRHPVIPSSRQPLARTPLHQWHAAQGASFANRDSWQLPMVYSSVEEEGDGWECGPGLADLSAFSKISLVGQGVSVLARELNRDHPAGNAGGVTLMNALGTALACRVTEDHLLLLGGSTSAAFLEESLATRRGELSVIQTDVTTLYAGFCLVGAQMEEGLRRVTAFDVGLASLPPGSCAETGLAGVQALLVRPPAANWTAVLVFVAWDLGEYVWERLWEAGYPTVIPLGMESFPGLAGPPAPAGQPV